MTGHGGLAPRGRVESVDLLRGVIMIVMALDHTRDFFGNYTVNPTDLATTTVPLFLTRWITHFCAPVFALLVGTGAYLSLRNKSRGELSRFLITRGAWLILLEVTVWRFGIQFNVDYRVTGLLVLWSLGWCMIALGALLRFSTAAITTVGVAMIVLHNALDGIRPEMFGALAPVWTVLHSPGLLLRTPGHAVFVSYVLIPWIGVTAVGFGLGAVYTWPAERRRAFLLQLGLGLSAAFVVLRAVNVYGDPRPWSQQATPLFTILSFMNTTKYAPSLSFLLMTLGPSLCFLALVDRHTPRLLRPAITIGKVPLFYYLAHFTFIHLLALIVAGVVFGNAHALVESPSLDRYPFTQPAGWGFGLPVVYAVWALVVVMMYPLCRWFADLKRRRNDAWLSYF